MARLRLIKHFVDGLGLNLAGVEMALSFASELLKMRMRLSYSSNHSRDIADSIKRIDGMLANLGIRVIKRRGGTGGQGRSPGDGWFQVNPGEAVEFG